MVDIKALDSTKRDDSVQLGNPLEELVGAEFLAFGKPMLASVVSQSYTSQT